MQRICAGSLRARLVDDLSLRQHPFPDGTMPAADGILDGEASRQRSTLAEHRLDRKEPSMRGRPSLPLRDSMALLYPERDTQLVPNSHEAADTENHPEVPPLGGTWPLADPTPHLRRTRSGDARAHAPATCGPSRARCRRTRRPRQPEHGRRRAFSCREQAADAGSSRAPWRWLPRASLPPQPRMWRVAECSRFCRPTQDHGLIVRASRAAIDDCRHAGV
jgi:hypothetical protein